MKYEVIWRGVVPGGAAASPPLPGRCGVAAAERPFGQASWRAGSSCCGLRNTLRRLRDTAEHPARSGSTRRRWQGGTQKNRKDIAEIKGQRLLFICYFCPPNQELHMEDFSPTPYRLQSLATGRVFDDEGWTLDDPYTAEPALIRALYDRKQLKLRDLPGLYKFADWLPVHRILQGSSAPVTYKSEGLARHLGLKNLYITFSGWWPEKGAFNHTCSFKETESYSVMARIPKSEKRIMVVASAGNTARAFARVCSDNDIPLLLTLPYDNLEAMWFDEPVKELCDSGPKRSTAVHQSLMQIAF